MNKVKVNIWGRDFELIVTYQNYPGEEVIPNQELTLHALTSIDFADSLNDVEHYIIKENASDIEGKSIDNIFKYVMPKSIVITRDKKARVFAVLFDYKFDMEHGLAVVYENERYKAVGPQEMIL